MKLKFSFSAFLFLLIGATGGYVYYTFWGCKSGCPLQSNPLPMIFYGALLGYLLKDSFEFLNNNKKQEK